MVMLFYGYGTAHSDVQHQFRWRAQKLKKDGDVETELVQVIEEDEEPNEICARERRVMQGSGDYNSETESSSRDSS